MANPNREGEVPTERDRNGSELPEGWETANLRALTEVLDNQRIPVNSEERKRRQGDVPYFGATGQVGWIDDFLFDDEILLIGEDGAPFFDKSKPIAYIVRGKSWVNNHAHVLKANVATSNLYLKYFLDWFDFNGFVNGTTRLKLTQAAMNTIPVRTPPLAEQRRIVAKLEELLGRVSRAKARLDRIPALLKRFRQSVLSAACSGKLTADWRDGDVVNDELPETWKSVVFDSVMQCKPQNGLYKPQSSYGSGTRIVRIDAFYDGAIAPWKDLKRLELTPDEIALYGLSNGDLLINRVNSMKFLGKSALVRELSEPCVFESNMMRVRLKLEVVDPEYAVLYLQSWTGIQELRKNAKHAVNQSSINQDDVRSVDFNLPPLTEQKEIVRRVEQFFAFADQIEARLTKAQAQVDRLTQSILAKAFRGELVPTEAELARREGRDYEPASKLLERVRSSKDVEIGTGKKRRNRPTTRGKVSP